MGRIDLVKTMGLSGRIGPVVAYVTKDGKQVFRSYVKPRNPKTPKQKAQRAKFALANQALSPLHNAIGRGYPDVKNAYRTLVSKVYYEAIVGAYPDLRVDYSKIQLAAGKLQLPGDVSVRLDADSHTAFFRWDPRLTSPSLPGSDNDKVNIVCFNTRYTAETRTAGRNIRSVGEDSVRLSKHWLPADTHFWIYFRSNDLQNTSNSLHLQLE